MGNIYIKDIQFADTSKIEDGILYVDKGAVKAVALEDEHIKTVTFDIAKPGESVRITPVKDVIEPRVKVEGKGGVFPGIISKVDTVGSGKTYALKGMAVVTAGRIVGFQEGIIDMTGPGADYTPFSKTLNLVMVCEPVEGIKQHEYEKAVRFAGFRVAAYIGELARELTPDEIKVYETCGIKEGITQYPDLPRVAYVQMLQSQGLLHDTYVYGVDAKKTLPTILSPTEIMDGAIVSGNCVSACDKNPTYVHENNPVVHDLFEEHGKTLNFVCQIITNENVYLADKERSSDWTAKLCKMLDLDGVIVSQEGFGNPDTDLIMNCKKIEAEGIKTVIITDEYAGRDGKSQSLADADVAADAVVTGGNANEVVILPKLDKVIGTLDYVTKIAGASEDTFLATLSMVGATAGTFFLYDRLWHNSALNGTLTTAQTFTQPALTRHTDGIGVEIWLEWYTATGSTAVTATISYTNSDGVSGRTGTCSIAASPVAGQMMMVALQAGDKGVQSVQSVTLSATTGTAGNFGVTLGKRKALIPIPVANIASPPQDFAALGLPEIQDNACIAIGVQCTATNTGQMNGVISIIALAA